MKPVLLGLLALGLSGIAHGGSYLQVRVCDDNGCRETLPVTQHPSCPTPEDCPITFFSIVHPFGYSGVENQVEVSVCLLNDSLELEPSLIEAIQTWNDLVATTENCANCVLIEETPPTAGSFDSYSAQLHELGHCGMGLDHINRTWDEQWDGFFEETSYTRSADVAAVAGAIEVGTDGIRGTLDDFHNGIQGSAKSISWYRKIDNNPFAIDATVIDIGSFDRTLSSLPGGHSWPASANRAVGESLGVPNSQSVMYSGIAREMAYSGLTADDVNMVRMGMTGADRDSGTSDDYSLQVVYDGPCDGDAHLSTISVGLEDLSGPGGPGPIAECRLVRLDYSFSVPSPALTQHYSIVRALGKLPLEVRLNSAYPWDFGPQLFADGFESGDLSRW